MKIERTKNAARNIVFGMIIKIYGILVPFLMRTAILYYMGIQYLGLNSLFSSILQVLNLMELGVGAAMTYSMYKPIIEDDIATICALMKLYRKYYRYIGLVIAIVGIILTPMVPQLIKGEIPSELNIYVLYIFNLAATVLSYWLMSYKSSILYAYQRNDIINKISLITSTIQYLLQFGIIYLLHNYYIYVIVALVMQVLTNIFISVVVSIRYPNYSAKGELDNEIKKEINRKMKDLFTAKLGTVVVNSSDTIVISAFLGLTILAEYQNYYFILTAIIGILSVIYNSCTAGIGNSLIVESKEKNYQDFQKFTFLILWLSGVCTVCFLCLYQPFMLIWVGEQHLLPYSVVVCMSIYFYLYEINQLLNTYKDAAGIWHEDRYRPLVTALSNLLLNICLVRYWKLYGVILSTVISMLFIGIPWLFYNLFHTIFERKMLKDYLKKIIFYIVVTVIVCIISYCLCSCVNINKWINIIIRVIISLSVSNLVYYLTYHKSNMYKESVQISKKILKHRKY